MALVIAPTIASPRLEPTSRRLSNESASAVTGATGSPAAGRTILCLRQNEWRQWTVVAETTTDVDGRYGFTVQGGANDHFLLVAIGASGERSRALANIIPVVP